MPETPQDFELELQEAKARLNEARLAHPSRESVLRMKLEADAKEDYTLSCFHCKQKVFMYELEYALMPGHVNSESGRQEHRISGVCEYCFDEMFAGVEDIEDMLDGTAARLQEAERERQRQEEWDDAMRGLDW